MRRAKAVLAAAILAIAVAGCFPPSLSEAELTDAGIRVRLEQAFKAHRELDLRMVTLNVHDHVVTLSGMVNSRQDKRLLERIVGSTPGIERSFINVIVPE